MSRPVSRLFHAVVVVGASLGGCSHNAPASETPESDVPEPAAVTPEPAAAEPSEGTADAGVDAGEAAEPATGASNACPPGSERPFPPCYWIL